MEKQEIREKIDEGYLYVQIIIEIAGKPEEHVKKALNLVLEKLKKEKDIEIINSKVHEPKKVENLFSTFAEVELIIKNLQRLIELAFDYMPSSIEILEPKDFKLKLDECNRLINDLVWKLYRYDDLLKKFNIENTILKNQLNDILLKIKENKIDEVKKIINEIEKEKRS